MSAVALTGFLVMRTAFAQTATPTNSSPLPPAANPVQVTSIDSFAQVFLATLSILACLFCLWLVFFFGRKLETSRYLRSYLVDGARRQEYSVLERDLLDRGERGPLAPSFPPPEGFGPTGQLWRPNAYKSYRVLAEEQFPSHSDGPLASPRIPPSASEELRQQIQAEYANDVERERDRRETQEKKKDEFLAACAEWEKAELGRYQELLQMAAEEAESRAKERVPQSMDVSLLGTGWTFLLEFSTIIVIIFALLVLGLIGIMDGREIGTILAAIAGYVLGKSSSTLQHRDESGKVSAAVQNPMVNRDVKAVREGTAGESATIGR